MTDALPDSTARAPEEAAEVTRTCTTGAHLTLAVGYGGLVPERPVAPGAPGTTS
ncbi:hypothetical protein [Kitasatospora sp. NPDC089509]|uniref:hypothetical protein n=1 Tax=Kitasatospora sp. NPDC089509 TaxID=3364079 RepID=UPI00382C53E3